jgi:hypothetical protein
MSTYFDRPLVITTQSLINICSTGYAEQILEAIPVTVAVPSCILQQPNEEIDHLPGDFPAPRQLLETMIAKETLRLVAPETDAEWLRFFDVSSKRPKTQKTSGHVVCAIAPERNWGIISDQPIIQQFGEQCTPRIPVLTTSIVLHHWYEARSISISQLRTVLTHAKASIHYRVFPDDPLFDWWTYCMEAE